MKILLIGGTGNISSSITRLLLAEGHQVWLFNRGSSREFENLGARCLIGDRDDFAARSAGLEGLSFDAVADFICYTPEQAARDFELFRDRTRQFIFISSCTVYQKPLRVWPITEDTPVKNPFSQYAQGKIACELYLLERYREDDFPVTIIRPSHTYGEARLIGPMMPPQGCHWTLADRMIRGEKIIVQGDGRSIWTLTHSDDFAVGFAGLLGNRAAIGHAFHITSDELLSWDEIMTVFAGALGVEPRIVHLPSEFIEENWPMYRGNLLGDKAESLIFDNSKLKKFVPGFYAKIPFYQGIRRSVAFFLDHPEKRVIDDQYNVNMDKLIRMFL